jgi:enoyl-CoA hydratase
MRVADGTPHYVHDNLSVQDLGAVRVLRIDREDKLGALSSPLVAAIGVQIVRVRQVPEVRVVVVTGTGRGFVSGADISEYSGATTEEFAEYQRKSREVFDALERLPQITIAAVNGFAFGGGFEIALCCDFILAAENARFGLPEINLGLFPGGGGPQRLSREVGARWTKDVVISGRSLKPAELLERGIVSRILESADFHTEALAFAAAIAAKSPTAAWEAKRLIDGGRTQDLSTALTNDQLALAALFSSQDGQEGVRAFMEKRTPAFGPKAESATGASEERS